MLYFWIFVHPELALRVCLGRRLPRSQTLNSYTYPGQKSSKRPSCVRSYALPVFAYSPRWLKAVGFCIGLQVNRSVTQSSQSSQSIVNEEHCKRGPFPIEFLKRRIGGLPTWISHWISPTWISHSYAEAFVMQWCRFLPKMTFSSTKKTNITNKALFQLISRAANRRPTNMNIPLNIATFPMKRDFSRSWSIDRKPKLQVASGCGVWEQTWS